MTVAIGALRHLVTLQNPSASIPDGDGGYTQTFASLTPPTMWAEIKPATARDLERVTAGTVLSTATHLITMRWRPDVSTQTRVLFHDRIFSVTGVSNPDERDIELILTAVEVVT